MPSSQSRRRPSSFCTPTTSTLCSGGPLKVGSFQRSIREVLTQAARVTTTPSSSGNRLKLERLNEDASMAGLSWWQNAPEPMDGTARLNVPSNNAHRPGAPLPEPDRLRARMVDSRPLAVDFCALAAGCSAGVRHPAVRALAACHLCVSARSGESGASGRQYVRALHVRTRCRTRARAAPLPAVLLRLRHRRGHHAALGHARARAQPLRNHWCFRWDLWFAAVLRHHLSAASDIAAAPAGANAGVAVRHAVCGGGTLSGSVGSHAGSGPFRAPWRCRDRLAVDSLWALHGCAARDFAALADLHARLGTGGGFDQVDSALRLVAGAQHHAL